MLSSPAIIRRFTPPTCTLEIIAQSSPLSRWTKRPLFKDLRFKLRFDDPRKMDEDKIALEGDRAQLELLCEAVTHYVQDLLAQSPGTLPLSLSDSPSSPEKSETTEELHLKAQGLLNHNLFLGTLATEESGNLVQLSASQLFDLANALDEYSQEIRVLPTESATPPHRSGQPSWIGTAATVLVAVGLTATVVKLTEQPETSLETAVLSDPVPEQEVISPEDLVDLEEKEDNLPFPASPQGDRSPIATPTLPSDLSSTPNLSPPATVVRPTQQKPSSAQPKLPPRPDEGETVSPPQRTPTPRASSSATLPPAPNVQIVSPTSRNSRNQSSSSTRSSSSSSSSSPSSLSPPSPSSSSSSSPSLPPPPSKPVETPKIPENLPSLSGDAEAIVSADAPSSERIDSSSLITGEVNDALSSTTGADNPVAGLPAPPTEEATASEVKPSGNVTTQVNEVKQYFQRNWRPPENLEQSVEYSLQIGNDGSIQRIIPWGQGAKTNIDHTNMPLLGEPFISPSQGNPTLRVVLGADGSVNAFVESSNKFVESGN